MAKLQIEYIDPRDLTPAPWNPNKATSEDQAKLDASLARHNLFKPILYRTLADGTREILGGHWRRESAVRLGMPEVPAINLGAIPDDRAKEILLIDNGRYGHDDSGMLSDLLASMGDMGDLATFLPYDLADLDAIANTSKIDLDTLGLADEDDAPVEAAKSKAAKTHTVMRMKVSVEDAERISAKLTRVMKEQGFTESDQLTNAGDALSYLLLNTDDSDE